ncbi:double zinc ribbon domain-containing protein [Halegenticoccus soli]|uniref:double zinc ribbon domain-containing protein n=1 Tax=Halegenticoccus soli TaxID=1985678 RepID=UPI000C6E582E|nr:zinc ribbon domain-containing protein [Halegenticoccus soli]
MSKITFRADDDLVERLEAFDASKSEVMREALRSYLDSADGGGAERESRGSEGTLEDVLVERVDALIAERLDDRLRAAGAGADSRPPQDVNINVTVEGAAARTAAEDESTRVDARKTSADRASGADRGAKTCGQCGEEMAGEHVYCPNCGEKASHRVFCECGDEVRSDWAFCPSCGRRTPAADVLDRP